jgi:hypothetical protein
MREGELRSAVNWQGAVKEKSVKQGLDIYRAIIFLNSKSVYCRLSGSSVCCITTVKQVNTVVQQLLFPQHTFVVGSAEQEKPTITAIGLPLGKGARGDKCPSNIFST